MEKKRKKKGRPSLLDLQKRSLRLQKQLLQQERQEYKGNANPRPDPYLRFHSSIPGGGKSDLSPFLGGEEGQREEDKELGRGQGREKHLKLILRPQGGREGDSLPNTWQSDGSVAESNGEDEESRKRGIQNASSKATEPLPEGASNTGAATPLPDEKLLVFVLDRLQRKDSYGVFSEPVDPDELPDYHEIVSHPMDFGTVRKRLSDGFYANLEMFERDVFLICSNAMLYNAPDTIYFRQARLIQELARKDFESLRRESSDDSDPETKSIKRGRPPSKSATAKRAPGRPSELSWNANAGDSSSYGAGSVGGKKVAVLDEKRRRHTYNPPQPSFSVFSVFDEEMRQLVPNEIRVEHAYAWSLARFAAGLGPTGWDIAARQIAEALPSGTDFGRGWVREPDLSPDGLEVDRAGSTEGSSQLSRAASHGRNGFINHPAFGFFLSRSGSAARPGAAAAAEPPVTAPDLNVRFHSPDLALQL